MKKKNIFKTKFSPKKYISEKGRSFPIFQCLISDDYENQGLTVALIIRQQPNDKFMFTNLMIDRHCLGVKSSFCNCNFDKDEIAGLKEKLFLNGDVQEVDSVYFHNLVYASIDFAQENGFSTDKDFGLAQYVLDEDLIDDGIDEIEVGINGRPLFICGPHDNVTKILATLNAHVGEGNYDFIV